MQQQLATDDSEGVSSVSAKRKRPNLSRPMVSRACTTCAKKKARCSGDQPCESCVRSDNVCEYTPTQRRGPKKRVRPEPSTISQNRSSSQHSAPEERMERRTSEIDRLNPYEGFFNNRVGDTVPQTMTNNPLRPYEVQSTPRDEAGPSSSGGPLPSAGSDQLPSRSIGTSSSPSDDSGRSTFADRLLKTHGPHLKTFIDMLPQDLAIEQEGIISATAAVGRETQHSPPHIQTKIPRNTSRDHRSGSIRPETIGNQQGTTTMDGNGRLQDYLEETNLEAIADHPAISSLLYDIYWCFVHPLWPVIYRPGYDVSTAPVQYPLLHNAILAICCRYDLVRQSQDIPGLSSQLGLTSVDTTVLGDIFFRRAQEHLDKPERPSTISTVQALIMMSLRELARGHTREAWMSSGLAIRLAFDLNVHKQPSVPDRKPAAYIVEQESSRVLWGCFVLDKYISMIMGRPFMMRYIDIEAPLPSVNEADEYALWESDARQVIPNIAVRFHGVRSRTISIFNHLARLAVILERILESLYARRLTSSNFQHPIRDLDEALVHWQKQSSDAFEQPPNPLTTPNVLLLRLWYNLCLILVHRKHIKTSTTYPRDGISKTPLSICVEAANDVNCTVEMMETSIGLYRSPHLIVFIIFQAGIIHLANSTTDDSQIAEQGRKRLHQCIEWLNQIALTYALAPRYCHVLFSLEELSKRELKSSMELDAIMAGRRETRPSSPEFDFDAMFSGFTPALPTVQELAYGLASVRPTGDLGSSVSCVSQPTGPLQSSSMFNDPLNNLHDSFFIDMPLGLPNNVNGVAQWDDFTTNYGNLLQFDTTYQL